MKILSFTMKTILLLAIPALFFASCKDDVAEPCSEGDPAIVGCQCIDGTITNSTGSDACSTRGGVDFWICDASVIQYANIQGTITIDSADLWAVWQDSGEVQLTIFPKFVDAAPPTGAGWGAISPNILYPGFPGGTFALGAPSNAQNPLVLTYEPGVSEYHYDIEVDPGTYSALALGFRHDLITDPSLRTATLGVHWGMPDVTSHGIVLKVDLGGGNIFTVFDYPAPSTFTLQAGEDVTYNFKADFSFVNQWYQ